MPGPRMQCIGTPTAVQGKDARQPERFALRRSPQRNRRCAALSYAKETTAPAH